MPIHIWMPIKLLWPCCDALPVVHVKQKGTAVIICVHYFIFPFIHSCIYLQLLILLSGWGVALPTPRSKWIVLT